MLYMPNSWDGYEEFEDSAHRIFRLANELSESLDAQVFPLSEDIVVSQTQRWIPTWPKPQQEADGTLSVVVTGDLKHFFNKPQEESWVRKILRR